MTAPLDLARCARCSAASALPADQRLPLGSPWAILYGAGVRSQTVAEDVAQHCSDHDIGFDVLPIDEHNKLEIWRYASLIICLPDELAGRNAREVLHQVVQLVRTYRQHRSPGLARVLASKRWWDHGVVQLVGPRAMLRHPSMDDIRAQVCAVHYLEDHNDTLVNLIEPYFLPSCPATTAVADSVGEDELDRVWRHVKKWGVTTLSEVPRLLEAIKACVAHYESRGMELPAIYRPDNRHPQMNRLQLILAGHNTPVGDRKTWNENGSRVWREVRDRLAADVVPGFDRPLERRNTKHAQRDLAELYRNLELIDLARVTKNWTPAEPT
jgi:hypothetical protein